MSGIHKDQYQPVSAKTAAYTIKPQDVGTLFTNRGAGGAVTFTLPAIADVASGWWADFFIVADQTVTLTAPANKLTTFNNATATSAAFSTASEKIGGAARVVFDGTTYLLRLATEETQTVTVS